MSDLFSPDAEHFVPVGPTGDPVQNAWLRETIQWSARLPSLSSPSHAVRRMAALALSDSLARDFTAPAPNIRILTGFMGSPWGPIPVRRFLPAGDGPFPTQIWLHGGGFVSGTFREEVNQRLLSARALATGIQFLAVDYRLAPEHRFPAAIKDVEFVIATVLESPQKWGVDPGLLGLGGNSAGAAIATSTALRLRDDSRVRLHHLDLEVPALAMHPVGVSARTYRTGYGLDDAFDLPAPYLGGTSAEDPIASPADHPDPSGLPPTLLLIAGMDPLRDAALAFARRLEKAGVQTRTYLGSALTHGGPSLTAESPAAQSWQANHDRYLRLAYGLPPLL